MQLTKRLWSLIGLLVLYAFHDLVEKNLESVWIALGLDKLATEGVPQGTREAVMHLTASYITPVLSFLAGPFSFPTAPFWQGLVAGAILFSLPDIWSLLRRRQRRDKTWQPDGLHIAYMEIGIENLESEFYIRVFIGGFNASGTSISVDEIKGNIGLRLKMANWSDGDIPLSSVSAQVGGAPTKSIPNLGHIAVTLKQNFPRDLVPHLLTSLNADEKPYFEFRRLDVFVKNDNAAGCRERLPIWHGISLVRAADRIISVRNSVVTPSGVGPSSSIAPSAY